MPEYKVRILKRIFFSEESGFGVFNATVKGTGKQRIIVGAMLDVSEGDFLHIEGDIVVHPRFGEQIKVNSYKNILPRDDEGIINYLSSGRIKGIGKKTAERIVERFGKDTFKILEESPERLREIKGVGRNVVAEAKRNSNANKTIRELTVKLSPYGIGTETIIKIFKEFEDDSFSILESNPYMLIERIRGVGFRIADTIARGLGIAKNDRGHIKAGLNFYLTQFEQKNGDLYIDEPELLERTALLLDTDSAEVSEMVESMVQVGDLIREEIPEKVLIGVRNFTIEKNTARKLFELSREDAGLEAIDIDFAGIFKKISLELTGEQKDAVIAAVNNRITVITGGPGTGKTTIIRAIIESLKMADMEVAIAAPTGRAAKRIEESSLYQASTIHRLLKIDPETRQFVHNEQDPLKADAVIVDEFSMVDFFIFYSLLKAISQHTRLIIIGDKDQLPSVGPGNVLRDIIHSDYFNTIYLNRNFRQTEDSLIIENAYRINNGEELIFRPYSEDLDFVFIKVGSEAQAREKVLRILEYHKNEYSFNAPNVQVLVPMYRGEAGIDNLNAAIQAKFNPGSALTVRDRISYKSRDKVMQLKNNYDKVIFNGDQGIVRGFNAKEKKLLVDFDGPILEYTGDELDELTLSYAVSVHKAQGSEYDILILVLLPTHAIMLNRELFYTAVTRAKKKIFLVSDPVTVGRAVNNSSPSERKTLLPRRLEEVFNPVRTD